MEGIHHIFSAIKIVLLCVLVFLLYETHNLYREWVDLEKVNTFFAIADGRVSFEGKVVPTMNKNENNLLPDWWEWGERK